ncbi:IAA19-like protein [Sesbania bispinosa]|nr:IAA19-like protein [Sesbania bispinosa]
MAKRKWWCNNQRQSNIKWPRVWEWKRKMVSYKDICLGVKYHNTSSDDKDLFMEELEVGDEAQKRIDEIGFKREPLWPLVRLSIDEREQIRIPWK